MIIHILITLKFFRCSVGGETGVTITSTPQDTSHFSWEMEAFRYFGDSDGIIITCRILICRNRPIEQLTDECRRCGQRPFPLRRKRDTANDDESNVLIDRSVKSRPIYIAVRDSKLYLFITLEILYCRQSKIMYVFQMTGSVNFPAPTDG